MKIYAKHLYFKTMIQLNGKAKEDFKEWLFETYSYQDLSVLYPLHLSNALIIEFFDSVGIIINIVNQDLQRWFYYVIKTIERIEGFNLVRTRQEATIQAIKKANDIYNENNSMQM